MVLARRIEDLAEFDVPCGQRTGSRDEPSPETANVRALLDEVNEQLEQTPSRRRISVVNELLETKHVAEIRTPEERGLRITPVEPRVVAGNYSVSDGGIVEGEWIFGDQTDPDERLLFIHGGGFIAGSPLSHRPLSMALAERTGMAVLSIQYRMWPKFRRRHGLADVRAAYEWILCNGPFGASTDCQSLFVAGDSAGGNLALMLLQWARDHQKRSADAAVAFSPVTDVGLCSPTTRSGFEHDRILGQFFRRIHRIPKFIRNPLVDMFHSGWPWSGQRANPMISPVYGDLQDLPPTLIQGSESELLRGDAVRYTNKARAAGSEVLYQTWPGMPHAFPIFEQVLPEADEALVHVTEFLARYRQHREMTANAG